MVFVKVENGVVIQKSCNPEAGFVEVSDEVTCGYLATSSGFIAPTPTVEEVKAAIKRQIQMLDPSPQFRPLREFALGMSTNEAARLGLSEAQLYAANKGYAKMKDLEAQIESLRAQL